MRLAVIVVLLVVTTPSDASKSCMSVTEARQHFGSVHIYWHGKDHCWDARPTSRHHHIHKVQNQIHKVHKEIDEPKWQKAISEMLLDEGPVQTSWVDRWVDIQPPQAPIVARQVDVAREVDIVQVAPSPVHEPEPMITPRGVVMAIIAIAVTLAIVDVLFGDTIYRGPTLRRNRRWPQ
jgi:hypothetical protein